MSRFNPLPGSAVLLGALLTWSPVPAQTPASPGFSSVVPKTFVVHLSRESEGMRKIVDEEYRKFLGRLQEEASQPSLCSLLQRDELSLEVGQKLNGLLALKASDKEVAAVVKRRAAGMTAGDDGIPLVLGEVKAWHRDDIVAALKAGGFDGLTLAPDGVNIDFAFATETGGKPLAIHLVIPADEWDSPKVVRTVRSRISVYEGLSRDYHKVSRLLPAQHALRHAILELLDGRNYAVPPPRWFIEGSATIGSFSILRDLLGTNEAAMAYNAAFGQAEVIQQAGQIRIATIQKKLSEVDDLPQIVAANLVLMRAVEKHRIVVIPQIYERLALRPLGAAPSFGEIYQEVVKEPVPDVPTVGPRT